MNKIQNRRGNLADCQRVNPILLEGELLWVSDINKIKIGDGKTSFNDLPFLEVETKETIVKEITKQVGGGVSRSWVENYVDSAVADISGGGGAVGDYLPLSGGTLTGNLSLSNAVIDFDTTIGNPAYQEGRVFYDSAEKALSYYTDINGVVCNLAQEHLIKVKNVDGGHLADGEVVYVHSADGNNVTVKKARADLATTSRATIGVVTQACADNASTYITRLGKVHGLNTQALNEGDTIYLSATTAGAWTTTLPPAPARTVRIGYVTKKSAGDGHILVDVNDGLSLTEVNDVWVTSPISGDVLAYNQVTSRWENSNKYLDINGVDTSLSYSDGKLVSKTTSKGTQTFNYDIDGRLVAISGSGSYLNKSFTYDGSGNLINIDVI